LKEKVGAVVYKSEITALGVRHSDYVTPLSPQKLALTLLTSGGSSVGIVRSRRKATVFFMSTSSVIISAFGVPSIEL
jgi:hypothetical protein